MCFVCLILVAKSFLPYTKQTLNLLTASWLSLTDLCELEAAVQELLCHLLEESTSDQFNLLLLMIREALNASHWRVDNYRVRQSPQYCLVPKGEISHS